MEAEQHYWEGKHTMTDADRDAEREFSRILHAYLSPGGAVQAAMDTLHGRRSAYWESRPGDQPPIELPAALAMDESQRTTLAYGLRAAARMDAEEQHWQAEPEAGT